MKNSLGVQNVKKIKQQPNSPLRQGVSPRRDPLMNRVARHPEIVSYQYQGLNMLAVAVPKSGDEFCILLASADV